MTQSDVQNPLLKNAKKCILFAIFLEFSAFFVVSNTQIGASKADFALISTTFVVAGMCFLFFIYRRNTPSKHPENADTTPVEIDSNNLQNSVKNSTDLEFLFIFSFLYAFNPLILTITVINPLASLPIAVFPLIFCLKFEKTCKKMLFLNITLVLLFTIAFTAYYVLPANPGFMQSLGLKTYFMLPNDLKFTKNTLNYMFFSAFSAKTPIIAVFCQIPLLFVLISLIDWLKNPKPAHIALFGALILLSASPTILNIPPLLWLSPLTVLLSLLCCRGFENICSILTKKQRTLTLSLLQTCFYVSVLINSRLLIQALYANSF